MSSARSQSGPQAKGGHGRVNRVAQIARWFTAAVLLAVLAIAGGFFWFLNNVSVSEIPLNARADGIVVLTGGASRIEDAIELLASGNGRRLLISGVNPSTSEREIARLKPEHGKIITCCVDLDRMAVNTITNATETRRWVKDRGFASLIVVTSNYHMPRAMAELSHQLPDTTLIAYPVVSDQLKASWLSEPTLRLLFIEYVKYVAAVARMRLPLLDHIFA